MMKGPIQSVTISSDDPAPKAYDYELTLRFRFTTFDKPVDPELAVALNRILDDYCDGRLPFNVEMMMEGLYFCMKNAAYQVVQKAMYEKYGNEMIVSEDGRSSTSKAYLEAQAVKLDVPYLNCGPTAKIERIPTRKEIAETLTNDPETQRILSMTDEELAS